MSCEKILHTEWCTSRTSYRTSLLIGSHKLHLARVLGSERALRACIPEAFHSVSPFELLCQLTCRGSQFPCALTYTIFIHRSVAKWTSTGPTCQFRSRKNTSSLARTQRERVPLPQTWRVQRLAMQAKKVALWLLLAGNPVTCPVRWRAI